MPKINHKLFLLTLWVLVSVFNAMNCMAEDQQTNFAAPSDDWATVFLCRFDESPLKLEGSSAGAMYMDMLAY